MADSKIHRLKSGFFCDFSDAKYNNWLSRIERKTDRILRLLEVVGAAVDQEGTLLMTVQDDVQAAVAAVAANTSVVGSVKTLLDQLTALITGLKGQVTDPASVAALEAAISALQANNQALTDAVVANTPAASAARRK
jgi:hypothetical protein